MPNMTQGASITPTRIGARPTSRQNKNAATVELWEPTGRPVMKNTTLHLSRAMAEELVAELARVLGPAVVRDAGGRSDISYAGAEALANAMAERLNELGVEHDNDICAEAGGIRSAWELLTSLGLMPLSMESLLDTRLAELRSQQDEEPVTVLAPDEED